MGYDLSNLVKIRLETQGVKKSKEMDIEPNPCWDGYEPIGLNPDGSPNCVPIKEEQRTVKEGFPIPSPENNESQDVYIARCNAAISDEYGYEQANAICYAQWEKK